MTIPGTVLPTVRARLIELLAARMVTVAVGYHPPRYHVDLTAPIGGPLEAVWLAGDASADTVAPASLGTPVRVAETWVQTVVCQVLGRTTSEPQEDLDVRCGDLLGEVMDELSINPHLDLDVDGWGRPTVTPSGWRWSSGVLLRNSGAETANARVELDLSVRASRC